MKKTLNILVALVLFAGCSKHDTPAPQQPPLTVKDVNISLNFKIIPQSSSQVNISLLADNSRPLAKLYLKKDTSTIGTFDLHSDGNDLYSAVVNYNFTAGQAYNLVVQSNSENDTAFRYRLPAYTHTYVSPYQYEKLLSLTQSQGARAFDISPSRKTIFITDDVNNTLITKRLSLTDVKIDTLPAITYGLMIRAVSDSEVLAMTFTYNNRLLQADSAALTRFNVNTKQSSFVDFVSNGYGRFSRVINNHILVTEPYFAGGNTALIDLKDNSKLIFSGSSYDFRYFGEFNYDHLYYWNYVIDPATGAVQTKLPITDSSGIEYIDNSTGYTIVSKYQFSQQENRAYHAYYASKFSVYSNTDLVYENDYVDTRELQVGRQLDITSNRILLYQSFGYDTTYRIDGYYVLDLNSRRLDLLQCDSNPYVMMDFQLDTHTMISVRADGVYRVKMP